MSEDSKKPPKHESSIFLPEDGSYDVMQPWFVYENWLDPSKEIYQPRKGIGFTVHNTGAEIFPRVEEAIRKATKTIDIICWGFDPSMKLGGYEGDIRIGDLLRQKAEGGVEVRVLGWDLTYRMLGKGVMLSSPVKPEKSIKTLENYGSLRRLGVEQNYVTLIAGKDISPPRRLEPYAYSSTKARLIEGIKEVSKEDEQERIKSALNQAYWQENSSKRKKALADFSEDIYNYGYDSVKHLSSKRSNFEVQEGIVEDLLATELFYTHRQRWIGWGSNKLTFITRQTTAKQTRKSVNNDKIIADGDIPLVKDTVLKAGGTHHQKMVLIDYEIPNRAVGFVLGHNYHKSYWDGPAHSFFSPDRWPGFRPYQDISSEVYGPILFDLNDNFSKAWDKAIATNRMPEEKGGGLYNKRLDTIPSGDSFIFGKGSNKKPSAKYYPNAAQICRTETDYEEQVILSLYKNAFRNATSYIYLENQYFRHPGLADHLKEVAKKRMQPEGEHKPAIEPIYLFVLTNPPQSRGEGQYTYDMLDRLGHGESLPKIKRSMEQMYRSLVNIDDYGANPRDRTFIKMGAEQSIKEYEKKYPESAKRYRQKIEEAGGLEEFVKQLDQDPLHNPEELSDFDPNDPLKSYQPSDFKEIEEVMKIENAPGLKLIIGCLETSESVTPINKTGKYMKKVPNALYGSPVYTFPGQIPKEFVNKPVYYDLTFPGHYYSDIYIHSKLMTIDDAFFTLGSANINTRSFKADSELNIAIPDHQVAKETRENQWELFTKEVKEGENLQEISKKNYDHWKKVMKKNWKLKHELKALIAQLNVYYHPEVEAGLATD